jgi:hypothetical protein
MTPTPYVPLIPGVTIDPTNLSSIVYPGGNLNSGVFIFQNSLYAVCFGNGANSGYALVFNSTDKGATWNILDLADSPNGVSNLAYFVKGSTIYAATQASSGDAVIFYAFNLLTGLWIGTVFATSPVISQLQGLVVFNNGNAAIWGNDGVTSGDSGFNGYVYNGSSWGSKIDIAASLITASWYTTDFGCNNPSGCTDGNNVYLFNTATNGSIVVMFFVTLSFTGILSKYFIFPTNSAEEPPSLFPLLSNANINGWPSLVGSTTIVLPVYLSAPSDTFPSYPSVFVSFNLGQTWDLLMGPGCDPTVYASFGSGSQCQYGPSSATDGTNIYLLYGLLNQSSLQTQLRLCVANVSGAPSTWAWNCSTAQAMSNTPGFQNFQFPFVTWVTEQGSLLLSSGSEDNSFNNPVLWLGSFGVTPPAPTIPYIPTLKFFTD